MDTDCPIEHYVLWSGLMNDDQFHSQYDKFQMRPGRCLDANSTGDALGNEDSLKDPVNLEHCKSQCEIANDKCSGFSWVSETINYLEKTTRRGICNFHNVELAFNFRKTPA